MNDSYLNTFKGLFYNVDSNDTVKNTLEQASSVLASIITKFGEVENEMSCGTSRQDDFIDTVVCLFVRKIMEQIDAINVLFSVGLVVQAKIILRSFVENTVSLEFILKEDTEKRAAAYWLEHHYREIEMGERLFNAETELRNQFIVNMGQKAFNADRDKFLKKKEAFERIIISKSFFQEVDKDRKQKKGKKKHIKWYEVCSDVTSFKGLMTETGYEKYYEGIYGGLSYETHAYNSTMDICFDSEGICLKPVRNPADGGSTFSLRCNFAIGLLAKIYMYG